MTTRRCICFILSLVWALPIAAQETQDIPVAPFVDEAPGDSTFLAFRNALLAAVIARDVDAIVAMSDPDIFLEFNGDGVPPRAGRAEFRKLLSGEDDSGSGQLLLYGQNTPDMIRTAKQAVYLDALENVLRGGGAFGDETRTVFIAPHLQGVLIHSQDISVYDQYFISAEGANFYDRPSAHGHIAARLQYGEAVALIAPAYGTRFFEIARANGDTGFVDEQQLRPWLGYVAVFERRGDTWLLQAYNWQF
jgi:hypothetical protein